MTPANFTRAIAAMGGAPNLAKEWAEPLARMLPMHGIDTPQRAGAFIAQCFVETQGFSRLEENLMYTTPARLRAVWPSKFKRGRHNPEDYTRQPERLANLVYANRNGNGDVASGDGWRYRGRGIKQITGRANYAAVQRDTGIQCVDNPSLLAKPAGAIASAIAYWNRVGASAMADRMDWDGITRAVNGPAKLKAATRAKLTVLAMPELARR